MDSFLPNRKHEVSCISFIYVEMFPISDKFRYLNTDMFDASHLFLLGVLLKREAKNLLPN